MNQLGLRRTEIPQSPFRLPLGALELGCSLPHLHLEIFRERANLGVEARVLDRGGGLVRQRDQEAQIGVGERSLRQSPNQDHADQAVLERERRGQQWPPHPGGGRGRR